MLHEIDLSRTDLNLLVLFEAVMVTRHVGRAAERLSLSPSAVSHGLGRLRRLLDDPLFLKTPKGVVPTDRAVDLAGPISELLAQTRRVLASAAPFDPATSTRRFAIGAPDGVSAVFLSPLLAQLRDAAPGIGLSIRPLLPRQGETASDAAWRDAFTDLEARTLDVAVMPIDAAPARFHLAPAYEEDFVIAVRAGHPFAKRKPSIAAYCAARQLVVSHSGDPHGFVDDTLHAAGLTREVTLTAPNFAFALAVLAETDFVCAMPRRFVALQAPRFNVVATPAPLELRRFTLRMAVPKVALQDAGVAWMLGAIARACGEPATA